MKKTPPIIADDAQRTDDIVRLREAFHMAWEKVEARVADGPDFRQRLATLIVTMGNRRHDIDATELAASVARMFEEHN